MNPSQSDVVEFIDDTDIDTNDKPIIRSRLRLTITSLEDAAVDLHKAVGFDTSVNICNEIESTITVCSIK